MITIHAKNFKLSDEETEKIEAKAEKLLHLSRDMEDESTKIRVEFELLCKKKNLILGTITVSMPHDTLRAESKEEQNVVSIMDTLENKMRPQIEKHKGKVQKV